MKTYVNNCNDVIIVTENKKESLEVYTYLFDLEDQECEELHTPKGLEALHLECDPIYSGLHYFDYNQDTPQAFVLQWCENYYQAGYHWYIDQDITGAINASDADEMEAA